MQSIKELRRICQYTESGRTGYLCSAYLYRFFSIYVTRLLLPTSVTPNQLTFWGSVICILAPFLFLLQDYRWTVIGVALYFFGNILDFCDGEIARYRKIGGKAGMWYVEPTSHDIQYAFQFFPLGLAAYLATGQVAMVILGFSASLFKLLTRALQSRFDILHLLYLHDCGQKGQKNQIEYKDVGEIWPVKIYKNVFTSSGSNIFLMVAALMERYDLFTWFYGATFPVIFLLFLVRHYPRIQPYLKYSSHISKK